MTRKVLRTMLLGMAIAAVSPTGVPKAAQAAESSALDQREVMQAFDTWLKAWNAKEVDTYLGMYGREFRPPKGESRAAWEKQRRTLIWNKSYINVRAESAEISFRQNRATVRFLQVYLSDRLREESRKTLVFARERGHWRIVQESVQR
jgi:type I site-specific restriction endonuclease